MTDTRRDLRAPIALKIRYKSASVDEFAEQYAADISRGGVFIKSKTPLDVGTLLKFELQLKDETELVAGVGRVVWVRKAEDAHEDHPAGMGIKFVKMDGQSRTFVEELVKRRGDTTGRFDAGAADVTPARGAKLPAGEADELAPEDRSDLRNTSELLASAIAEAGVGGETANEALARGEEAFRKSQEVTGEVKAEAAEAEAKTGETGDEEAPEEKKRRGATIWVAAALAISIAGGAYLFFGSHPEPPTAEDPRPEPLEAAPAAHQPEETPEAPAEAADEEAGEEEATEPEEALPPYRLTIVTDPPGAKVKVGKAEVVSPAELTFEEAPRALDVTASLSGHRSARLRVRASSFEETERGTHEARIALALRPLRSGSRTPSEGEPKEAPAPKPEAKTETKAEARPSPSSEGEPKEAPAPKPEAKTGTEAKAEIKTETKAEPVAPKPQAETEFKPAPEG